MKDGYIEEENDKKKKRRRDNERHESTERGKKEVWRRRGRMKISREERRSNGEFQAEGNEEYCPACPCA